MTTRKPFSIRTQNELNISKTNEDKAEKRNMASKKQTTKIIKVNKTNSKSKIYINKKDNNGEIKLVSGNTTLLAPSIEPSVEGVQLKKIADDIENAPPTMNDKQVRVDQPHEAIIRNNEESSTLSSVGIFLGKENNVMRKTYSIHHLLKMEPKESTKPFGFENWPEELRNPKPREIKTPLKKNNINKANSSVKKRSPSGEASPMVVNIGTSNINHAQKCIEQSNILELLNIAANENNKSIITKDSNVVLPSVQFIPVQTLKPLIEKTNVVLPSSPLKLDLTPIKNTSNIETDDRRLDQRQKQIDLGKKTLSYYMYCKKVPIFERKKGCPVTPRKNQICSKRSWDGQVRKWRRMLHDYDPKTTQEIEEAMRLYPEETKYLLQKRQEELEGKTVSSDDNKEIDEENFDDVL